MFQSLHFLDIGTASEVSIVKDRKSWTLLSVFDEPWTNIHGFPVAVSADDEFDPQPFRFFLNEKCITLKPRRKEGTIK